LQHLVGVFEEVPELVARRTQYFLGKLRRNLNARYRGIFRHITDLVDLDTGISRERGFQLFGKGRWLGVSAGEGAHKSRELGLGEGGRKMNARDS